MDSLGDRMKRYESVSNMVLTPKSPVIVRVDGRSFHNFLRESEKPFDDRVIFAMVGAANEVSKQISGFKLAYVASDEASFYFDDCKSIESNAWYGNNLQKIVSVTASLFTGYFNHYYFSEESVGERGYAVFDARAFVIPEDDLPNYFVWRSQDWHRNSLQMLARHVLPAGDLDGVKTGEIHEKLREKGVIWDVLPEIYRYGTWVTPKSTNVEDGVVMPNNFHSREDYYSLSAFFGRPIQIVNEDENKGEDAVNTDGNVEPVPTPGDVG